MPQTTVTVRIRDTTTGHTSTQTFDRSPILIGRGPWNALSLETPSVAALHGEIWFGPGFLAYLNLTSQRPTLLHGRRLRAGELVHLSSQRVIAIGPYQIEAGRELVGLDHQDSRAEIDRSVAYVTRALAVIASFASPLLELRRQLSLPGTITSSDAEDPYEIVRRLLTPPSSDPASRRRSDA